MEEKLADLHLCNIDLSMELTELEQEVHDAWSVDSFSHETFHFKPNMEESMLQQCVIRCMLNKYQLQKLLTSSKQY